jgi:hypothetical protein
MGKAVIHRVPRAAYEALRHAFQAGGLGAARAALSDLAPRRAPRELSEHLDETVRWLFRAHDACERGGVSRSYCLRRHARYHCTGWLPAYPETTGYIVPTLYEVAELCDWPEARERAEQMARWEAAVQMEDGAVRGGTIADPPSPAVFNTGQVLFGWLAAAAATGDASFESAASRAARFLIDAQDPDGAWRKGASRFASAGGHVYNARAAWALALWGKRSRSPEALAAACHSADFALAQQNDAGWYAENCLTDHDHPLVHTIAYAAQGVLEIGLLVEEQKYVDAARRTARALAEAQQEDGFLAGRYDAAWRPAVPWSCLTGNAQMALVWARLAEVDHESAWLEPARRAVEFVLSTQRLDAVDPGVRGGVSGSYPIWGGYGTYEYLNWAAKFLVDALLSIRDGTPRGTCG